MTFHRTATTYQQGARTLPGEYYTSAAVFAEERERLFAASWHCIGRLSRFDLPGQYALAEVAGESLVVLRDQTGVLRAYFNVCRHRGTRLCVEPTGRFSETIQCPYHAWTWNTEGQLIGAPHMQEVEGFARSDYPLHEAVIAEWEGFVFLNIARDPVPFAKAWAPMVGRLARFGLAGLGPMHRARYAIAANWKLVFQNYSECQHCPTIHPQLNAVLPYQSGANDLTEGPFLGGYMELTAGNDSATMSGHRCALLLNDDLPPDEHRRAYYYTLMPNLLLSIHPDYVNYYLLHPVSERETVVESEWMFRPGSEAAPGFNPDDAVEFWDRTNRQDWDIIERGQLGIASARYAPGPYSPRESIPAAWDREYLRQMRR